ncbi:unnamed protein product [Closterium sp. Naga37s-1]|nr:unnamed protein product [Closterium sp. Naga37s-1]
MDLGWRAELKHPYMRNTLFPTPSFLSLRFTPPASILVLRHPVRTFPSSLPLPAPPLPALPLPAPPLPAPPLPAPPLAPSGHGTGGGAVHAQQPLCRGAHFPFLAFAPCFSSLAQGMAQVEELYTRNSHVVERLKDITKVSAAAALDLGCEPYLRPDLPTLCLVGAPNVGKSSLVRAISSGKPEVCNYPFTTRGISMGHFYVDDEKHQQHNSFSHCHTHPVSYAPLPMFRSLYYVAHTLLSFSRFSCIVLPGLLLSYPRPAFVLPSSPEQRNSIELLTIAAITHLPTAVLFVHDPSEECGVNRLKQYQLYREIKTRFSDRVWIDVISKCDPPAAAPTEEPPGGQSEEADGDRRSAGLADLLPEGASENGRREGEEGMGSGGEASDITEGRHTGGSNRSDSDRRETTVVLLGEVEAAREAHGGENAEVAVTAASVAAWEEYKAHGGPAAALRVSTVAGVGVEEVRGGCWYGGGERRVLLVQTIQAMLCAHFLGSADSSLPASLVAPPTATPSQSLPATQPAHTEGSTLFLEDAAGQSSRHSLEASEGENATGGGSGKAGKKGKASDFYYPPLPSHMMKGA